jgi:hypothetical protein
MKALLILTGVLFLSVSCKKDELKPIEPSIKGIKRVWALDDGEKIKKEDVNNPLASDPDNLVWKNNKINLFGARNEIIAFQIIIQAEKGGVEAVNVTVSDLKNGGYLIKGSSGGPADPFNYQEKNIELFTEHYLNITKRTPPFWGLSPTALPSEYYTGWVPDCLIPFSAPSGKGGAPFSIDGNENQGVWVDIYIPRDATPGIYTGDLLVTHKGNLFSDIPVSMEVFDFVLPDSSHIRNMFGFGPWDIAPRHGVSRYSKAYYEIEARYFQLAHRHRFDLVNEVYNLERMTNYYKKYYSGEAYNTAFNYSGPGENIGNTTFSIGYGGSFPEEYGGSVKKMNKTDWWEGSDAWETWFMQNAPDVERHKYLFPDEPDWKGPAGALGTGSMDTIRMQAEWTHSNPGPGRNIPCLVTNTIRPVIKGYVDFWSVSSEEVTENASVNEIDFERAQGHKYGIYNGYRPGMGAVITDADAVEFRVMPWIVWKYNLDQYFYWSVSYWTNKNVFKDPLTYDSYNGPINGDGTFLYPGEDKLFLAENRGLEGPLSSIRAKNWRRGAQDFEYLWLAKKAGYETEANAIVDKCVPAALWEARQLRNISWSSRGYTFEGCRKELAFLLGSIDNK